MHHPVTQGAPQLARRTVVCVVALVGVVALQIGFDACAHAHSGSGAAGAAHTIVVKGQDRP
ncbi:hypothetical protein P3T36_006293 [Kitasatospora sp. MAP12-15]|uniref:hypothetical protein n=1 Tax=unclassified Kitasatospora TaxID=2633591 RepID=UPI0024757833|nr:hypothetical protein [Kitasatospora sp. MAP12-44]MDH6108914.1 hypothetical protein [Kitasatospora sp. MAP12-44]